MWQNLQELHLQVNTVFKYWLNTCKYFHNTSQILSQYLQVLSRWIHPKWLHLWNQTPIEMVFGNSSRRRGSGPKAQIQGGGLFNKNRGSNINRGLQQVHCENNCFNQGVYFIPQLHTITICTFIVHKVLLTLLNPSNCKQSCNIPKSLF